MQLPLYSEIPKDSIIGTIDLVYIGETTDKHSIDAELYARSVLGFAKSFKRVNKILLGKITSLEVHAEKPSSFKGVLDYVLSPDGKAEIAFWIAIMSFFGIDAKSLKKVPMMLFEYLIDLIKKGKGKGSQIRKQIEMSDFEKEVKNKILQLIESSEFRRSLDEMTYFLQNPALEEMQIKQKDVVNISINKYERPYFISYPEDEVIIESDDKVVSMIYISPEKSKWQFKSGSSQFWADVLDTNFLQKMKDKNLDEIVDLKFIATVEKTTVKEANTRQVKISRIIKNFKLFSNQTHLKFLI